MAAFAREAFEPGRIVYFHSQPIKTEAGSITYSARYGGIDAVHHRARLDPLAAVRE